jgi:hypothetical protein
VSMVAGVIWAPLVAWLVWTLPSNANSGIRESSSQLALLSLVYPLYYMGASWVISVMHWRKQLQHRKQRTRSEATV